MVIALGTEEKDMIIRALGMWKNYIESGNIILSAADAFERGEKVKPLSESQMRWVLDISDLIKKFCKG